MKKILTLIPLAALLLAACSQDLLTESRPQSRRDSIMVKLVPPQVIAPSATATRAEPLNPEPPMTTLPIGTTLWLTYRETKTDKRSMKGYVVQADATTGGNGLFAMKTQTETIDGTAYYTATIDEETASAPLYLEEGTYEFRIMSPAYPIRTADHAARIDNGMYLYATDDRYTQTMCEPQVVNMSEGSGVFFELQLKPIIQQVAQIQVCLKPGKDVTSLEMMEAGLEIGGLQDPITNAAGYDFFPLGDIENEGLQYLPVRLGDKHSRVTLPGSSFQMEDVVYKDNATHQWLTGRIGVLPTDASSTGITLLLSMAVNGVPTQYFTMLNGMVLKHNHSYNVLLEINLNDAIVVGTWQSQAWSADLKLN